MAKYAAGQVGQPGPRSDRPAVTLSYSGSEGGPQARGSAAPEKSVRLSIALKYIKIVSANDTVGAPTSRKAKQTQHAVQKTGPQYGEVNPPESYVNQLHSTSISVYPRATSPFRCRFMWDRIEESPPCQSLNVDGAGVGRPSQQPNTLPQLIYISACALCAHIRSNNVTHSWKLYKISRLF